MPPDDVDLRIKAYLRRRQLREQAVNYKGGECEICGYDRCLSALEFHHPDPLNKEFNISDRVTSFEAIKAELDKCHLLCANCHREVHDGLHPRYLLADGDSLGFDFEQPEDPISYLDELELDETLENVSQQLAAATDKSPKRARIKGSSSTQR